MPTYTGLVRSKLPAAGTTIFAIMSGLAQQTGAINLSQGFPDFEVSAELIGLVEKMMRNGHNQYAPMPGIISLRERIAEKMQARFGAVYHPETEITITAGGTQALFTAISALIHKGDEVIVIEPAYDCYNPAIELAGGKAVYVNLSPPDYAIPWAKVKKLITPQTKMIIINSPHNPTGSVLSSEDLQQLDQLTKGTDIIILSDEVYEHILFDGIKHQSVARYPSLAERSLIIYSFGKTFHATGWKCGYCVGPASLMKEFRKVHQFMVFSVNTPLQYALQEFMSNPTNYSGLESFYQEKRDYFRSMLTGSQFRILPCYGSYFQLLDYSAISEENDTDYAIRLTKENGVAAIPVSVFYNVPKDDHLLRFCFAKSNETLERAAERLVKVEISL